MEIQPQTKGILKDIKSTDEVKPVVIDQGLDDRDFRIGKSVLKKAVEAENMNDFVLAEKYYKEYTDMMSLYVSKEDAKECMGEENFFAEEEIAKAFNVVPSMIPEAPEIPFSYETLYRAGKEGYMLVYRIDSFNGNIPMTIENMYNLYKGYSANKNIVFQFDRKQHFYSKKEKEDFAFTETPRKGWALVKKEVIDKDLQFNDLIVQIDRMMNVIYDLYKDDPNGIPDELNEAIKEYKYLEVELTSEYIDVIFDHKGSISDRVDIISKIVNLKINQLCRRNVSEVIFDLAVHAASASDDYGYLLSETGEQELTMTRTKRKNHLVAVKDFEDLYGAELVDHDLDYDSEAFRFCPSFRV